jgi:sugar phosphate isomerase/epimerase
MRHLNPKFSLGSWAFSFGPFEKDPWSFDRFLRYAAEAEYDGVEINGFRPHPHPDDFDSRAKCEALKNQIADLGLGISGYGPDFRGCPPGEIESAAYLTVVEKCLRFCEWTGTPTLRVDSVSPPDALSDEVYRRRFDRLVETWRRAAERCRESGVRFVWEYEPGFWLNKPSEVRRLVDEIDCSGFQVMFDTSHSYMGAVIGARQTGAREILPGGIVEYAELLIDKIGAFHVIDSDGTLHNQETSAHTPFGEGHINFKELLQTLASGVADLEWWCVDFCFCPTTETDAKKAIPFLKSVLRQLSD